MAERGGGGEGVAWEEGGALSFLCSLQMIHTLLSSIITSQF